MRASERTHVGPVKPVADGEELDRKTANRCDAVDGVARRSPDRAGVAPSADWTERVVDKGAVESEELGVDDLVIEHGAVESAIDAVVDVVCA